MHNYKYALLTLVGALATAPAATAQEQPLTLDSALVRASETSARVMAARERVAVARARERQAGAFPNPTLSYSREQTGDGSREGVQDIIAADQLLEWPGLRDARRDAARARISAAEAELAWVEQGLTLQVTGAYARAVAADRVAQLADSVARAFANAVAVSETRLREGDISGFAARRMRLESARYAARRADAVLRQRAARLTLAALLGDSLATWANATLAAVPVVAAPVPSTDSLVQIALRARGDLRAAIAQVEAARADRRRTAAERTPTLMLTAGSKSERIGPGGDRLTGFVAGVALPLPLWDRRGGAVAAAEAGAHEREAELSALRRQVRREVLEAAGALVAVQDQLRAFGPSVQDDAAAALRAAQTAYAEGEITLLEWLDTVRAYEETEALLATLRADLAVRAAALARAVGDDAPTTQEPR